ncbi:hypothetical protein SB725_16060 [Pseudomonas sp. SIMBA_041]|uniref:hypothetical protein n=1 Tax=unclassified Pseudomonas TaxID=196821 RepID=UPI0007212FF6|nr:hypothetical protein [Pseudomonas sp. URMO17WK12:I11]CRL47659.1 hypothetical protein PSHI_06900 [Pseudomonas sp. URMO17WK12:I11]
MRYLAIFVLALLSDNAHSANATSVTDDEFYKAYSVVSTEGKLPIRDVIVKRVSEDFTSYRGFQLNCVSRKLSDTGFFSSPDAARRELSTLKASDRTFKLLTDEVWAAACGTIGPTVVSKSVQPPNA